MKCFDISYGEHGPSVDFHFCREWDEDGGCYGTNRKHGLSWEEARVILSRWHETEADRWRTMTFEEWEGNWK